MLCWAMPFTPGSSSSTAPSCCSISGIFRVRRTPMSATPEELAALQAAFAGSRWAARTPGRGRGAVRNADRRYRGARPHRRGIRRPRWRRHRGGLEDRRAAARTGSHAAGRCPARRLPFGVGRVAGCPQSSVRTAFYYVRSGVTVVPDELPEPTELAGLLADSTAALSPADVLRYLLTAIVVTFESCVCACAGVKPMTDRRAPRVGRGG